MGMSKPQIVKDSKYSDIIFTPWGFYITHHPIWHFLMNFAA